MLFICVCFYVSTIPALHFFRDAFASSLRESSGVAVGAQKEMSVIEHHRKQSMQKAQQQEQRGTAYSISSYHESPGAIGAHTGRTSAYGGRDYEYSANLASTSRWAALSSLHHHTAHIAHFDLHIFLTILLVNIHKYCFSSRRQSSQAHESQSSFASQAGSFNARQVAGYSASRQTGAALIQQVGTPLRSSSSACCTLYPPELDHRRRTLFHVPEHRQR